MMLLTSCAVDMKKKESIWKIVEYYLARWKCDESFRYIKQCYNLEDIRVRSYISIRNIVVLVLAVSYFGGGVSWAEHKAEIADREGLSDIKTVLRCAEFLQLRDSRRDFQSLVP